jgi:hypothetical protein
MGEPVGKRRRTMTITAREAISITACRYKIIRPNPKLEAVAVCANAAMAEGTSLLALKSALLERSGEQGFRRFFLEIPEAAREYP